MSRRVLDPGPIRFRDVHGAHKSTQERYAATQLLKRYGGHPATSTFALLEVSAFELIESEIVEAHLDGKLEEPGMFDYPAWVENGAPERPVRELYATIDRLQRLLPTREAHRVRCKQLEDLYARGVDVDPLIAMNRHFALSSGGPAALIIDGRHRLFAAVGRGIESLPVYWMIERPGPGHETPQ